MDYESLPTEVHEAIEVLSDFAARELTPAFCGQLWRAAVEEAGHLLPGRTHNVLLAVHILAALIDSGIPLRRDAPNPF